MERPQRARTLSRCSFPPELRVQMRKCFVNKKHCLSPSFFKDSEPRRTLLSFPLSTEGTWIREPGEEKWRTDSNYNLARTMPLAITQGSVPQNTKDVFGVTLEQMDLLLLFNRGNVLYFKGQAVPSIVMKQFWLVSSSINYNLNLKEGQLKIKALRCWRHLWSNGINLYFV